MVFVLFKKIKKWKMRETWFYHDRKQGYRLFIRKTPTSIISNQSEYYHFEISCTLKLCKKSICDKDKCSIQKRYSSLQDNIKFGSFDLCKDELEKWYENYIRESS
jgi:hypothetical protein